MAVELVVQIEHVDDAHQSTVPVRVSACTTPRRGEEVVLARQGDQPRAVRCWHATSIVPGAGWMTGSSTIEPLEGAARAGQSPSLPALDLRDHGGPSTFADDGTGRRPANAAPAGPALPAGPRGDLAGDGPTRRRGRRLRPRSRPAWRVRLHR